MTSILSPIEDSSNGLSTVARRLEVMGLWETFL